MVKVAAKQLLGPVLDVDVLVVVLLVVDVVVAVLVVPQGCCSTPAGCVNQQDSTTWPSAQVARNLTWWPASMW